MFLYVGSPYSHPDPAVMEQRFQAVRDFTVEIARSGTPVYSPILHWHPAACCYELPRDAVFWQEQNFALLRASRALMVLMLPGWEDSIGLRLEIQECGRISKPAFYSQPGSTWSKLF